MGAGNAGSTGGGGGVGPAGRKTDGTLGTAKDAKKASERYEFRNRGAKKLDNQKIISPVLNILKGPFKAGTKVNRDFFINKVLGSKNFKGINKKDFLNKTEMQQEKIYGGYMKGRQLGKTDAYGNTLSGGKGDNDNNNQTPSVPLTISKFPTPNEDEVTPTLPYIPSDEDKNEDKKYDSRRTKKKGRNQNLLTSARGVMKTSPDYSLGKKSLLGQVV